MESVKAIDRTWWTLRSESEVQPDPRLQRIFRRLANDEVEAMSELYDGYGHELFGFATWITGNRQDAEGIVQEVLLKLWRVRRRLARVRHQRPYLLRIVRNTATDRHRHQPPGSEPLNEDLLEPVLPDPTRAIAARRATQALLELSEKQRTTIYLRLFSDCTFREIGRITGVSTFTAASRFRLGIEKLRDRLEEGA